VLLVQVGAQVVVQVVVAEQVQVVV